MSKSNYYRTLGVHQNASEKDIRKAYIALALKYHPDKNEEKDAREKFQEIQSAYETLSDRDKRKVYDDSLAATRQRKNLYGSESSTEDLDPSPFTWPYDMGGGGVSDIPWVFLWDQEHIWDGTSSIFDSLNFFLEGIHGILGRIRDPLFRNIGMIHEMMSNPFTESLYMSQMRPPGRARSATRSREGMYCRCHRHFPHAHGTSPTLRQKTIPTHRHLNTRHSASATTKGSHKRRAKTAGKD